MSVSDDICKACGQKWVREAVRLSVHGMYDNHTFMKYKFESIDGLINEFRDRMHEAESKRYEKGHPGPPGLGSVGVIDKDGKIIRTVGETVWPDYTTPYSCNTEKLRKYKEALLADEDIVRLTTSKR